MTILKLPFFGSRISFLGAHRKIAKLDSSFLLSFYLSFYFKACALVRIIAYLLDLPPFS
ncbi:hypothetical protein RND71_036935 [Anisodus tanguticus]|uniref:Uncharacterized protein n=1 Tax=Anisodus tanguticus TaxID=243964 RepID=A0AAE1UYC8_9SOLA|nr:hypothetical protein RND71_036935 [Anisodus tanguticus]